MNLGERYWSSRLHNLSKEQKASLGKYPKNFGQAIQAGAGLFLWGENSTGKTFVAAAFCIEATEKFRVSSYMIRASELKAAWIEDAPAHPFSQESVTERISQVRLLVIDDLGKEYRTSSGFSEVNFGSLLRDRCKNKLVTFITTNQSHSEFLSVYGSSTAELVKECMIPVKLPDGKYRDMEAGIISKFLRG